jgi:hypothetical protein
VRYYRERIALARARMYGHGRGSNARLQELERGLERAELRLRERQSREQRAGEQRSREPS